MKFPLKTVSCCLVLLCCSNAYAEGKSAKNAEIRQCAQRVREDFLACKSTCGDNKKTGKAACGLNPECHQLCSATYDSCKESFEQSLDTCKEACEKQLDPSKEICKVQTQCGSGSGNPCFGSADFRECLRPALLIEFACKQDCRDKFRTDATVKDALKACVTSAVTCHKACKAATPTPTPVPGIAPVPKS